MLLQHMFPPCLVLLWVGLVHGAGNLLHNAGFESNLNNWHCWSIDCSLSSTAHSGHHSIKVTNRHHSYEGPSQDIQAKPGHSYDVTAYVKLPRQHDVNSEKVQVMITIQTADGDTHYVEAAASPSVHESDGWVKLSGQFTMPNTGVQNVRYKIQGPRPGVNFLVDDVTATDVTTASTTDWRKATDDVINRIRKNDIHVQVTNSRNLDPHDLSIQVLQTNKSFPWGTAVKAAPYNDNAEGGKYRDFIHRHFNWAVLANALKWPQSEHTQGHTNYQSALDAIHGLKQHGMKVRGHNIVWSVSDHIQNWVKALSGDALRHAVQHRITDVMNVTRGLLEHWDVNNENLHGQWFQDRLHDPDYNVDLFRMAHHADPSVKLFLNDYNVVSTGQYTQAYLKQARQFKAAHVGLYGIGTQCHFPIEQEPHPQAVKDHLDTLAQAGLPIWVTELDAVAKDENKRADYYEIALRSLYGHPAVEGIIFWGFWAPTTWRGEAGSLVSGNHFQLTAAGRRVLDLLEREWMTDESHVLAQAGDQFTVRGFHGDYEVHVRYQGQELKNSFKTFSLGKQDTTVHITL